MLRKLLTRAAVWVVLGASRGDSDESGATAVAFRRLLLSPLPLFATAMGVVIAKDSPDEGVSATGAATPPSICIKAAAVAGNTSRKALAHGIGGAGRTVPGEAGAGRMALAPSRVGGGSGRIGGSWLRGMTDCRAPAAGMSSGTGGRATVEGDAVMAETVGRRGAESSMGEGGGADETNGGNIHLETERGGKKRKQPNRPSSV